MTGGLGLREHDPQNVVAAPGAGLAQKSLLAGVGQLFVVGEIFCFVEKVVATSAPAGQSSGRLAHVLLGVVADAQRKQFQQLAGKIFVGMTFVILAAVEPN